MGRDGVGSRLAVRGRGRNGSSRRTGSIQAPRPQAPRRWGGWHPPRPSAHSTGPRVPRSEPRNAGRGVPDPGNNRLGSIEGRARPRRQLDHPHLTGRAMRTEWWDTAHRVVGHRPPRAGHRPLAIPPADPLDSCPAATEADRAERRRHVGQPDDPPCAERNTAHRDAQLAPVQRPQRQASCVGVSVLCRRHPQDPAGSTAWPPSCA
jgi:hypothetical protein